MTRALPVLLLLAACTSPNTTDDSGTGDSDGPVSIPESYSFEARDGSGSSVSYSGQVFRNLLIGDLKGHVGGLTERIDGGWFPAAGDVTEELDFYLAFDSDTSGTVSLGFSAELPAEQLTYDDVSSGKDLWGKLAGNDPVGQHKDWSADFVGGGSAQSPEALVEQWVAELDAAAVARSNGDIPLDPTGSPIGAVYLTEDGRDLAQLTEKFLRVGIAFSQATDDYLDDDIAGKGLLASHAALEEGASYTSLEHAWDEGFGYFGAARTYGDWADDEVALGYKDVDGSGTIDLMTEVSYGHSTNAGKRDRDAVASTDFTADAWEGFVQGRALIASAEGDLTDEQLAELQGWRDQAIGAWEKAIAATVVHYINQTVVDTAAIGTDDYRFADHAKHWSELKGFALGLQFNPRSPLTDADFEALHEAIGDAPALTAEGAASATADLLAARALIGDAYDFAPENLGTEEGTGGW